MRFAAWELGATVALVTTVGCHNDADCRTHPLPKGTQFEVTVTENMSATGCATPTAVLGETFTTTLGKPVDIGANAPCLFESVEPPPGRGSRFGFDYEGCRREVAGYTCSARPTGCSEESGNIDVSVVVPPIAIGAEGEGAYEVHLYSAALGDCPAIACQDKFRTRVKRLN